MTARDEWLAWRSARESELAQEHGWLSLTGFAWLPDEATTLPGLPGRWWALRAASGPRARPFARHERSTGPLVSGLSPLEAKVRACISTRRSRS